MFGRFRYPTINLDKFSKYRYYFNGIIILLILVFASKSGAAEGVDIPVFSWLSLAVLVLAFVVGLLDASLGMGYGSTLTPILILFGFSPLQIVPSVLVSQLLGGIAGGFAHHRVGNVDLKPGSQGFKIAMVLASTSFVGALAAVGVARVLDTKYLGIVIGVIIALVGVAVLLSVSKHFEFKMWKMVVLGVIASFNKTISGGGYGPLVMGGQIVSGIKGRRAVGITQLAEALVCFAGLGAYLLYGPKIDWSLTPALLLGALASVPLAALVVKSIRSQHLTLIIGFFATILGLAALVKALFF